MQNVTKQVWRNRYPDGCSPGVAWGIPSLPGRQVCHPYSCSPPFPVVQNEASLFPQVPPSGTNQIPVCRGQGQPGSAGWRMAGCLVSMFMSREGFLSHRGGRGGASLQVPLLSVERAAVMCTKHSSLFQSFPFPTYVRKKTLRLARGEEAKPHLVSVKVLLSWRASGGLAGFQRDRWVGPLEKGALLRGPLAGMGVGGGRGGPETSPGASGPA